MATDNLQPWGETKVIGKPLPPADGFERVSGRAVFSKDILLPNLLHAANLRCPHAHANVKKIDTAKAREMPGVRAILTDADPEAHAVGWYAIPGVGGRQSAGPARQSRLFDSHCRYEGDEIAVVAAETEQQAWDAVRAIKVDYEVLPFVIDIEEALKPGAPPIHPGGNMNGPVFTTKRGDVAKGFAEADFIVEDTIRTQCIIHSNLEVHGSVAQWDGDTLTVWDSTQGVFGMQSGIAAALNMPMNKVRVIGKYCGGAFGSKLEAGKYSVIAGLLSKKAGGRPVRLFMTREEAYLNVGNRAPLVMKMKFGAKKDGTLTAIQLNSLGGSGAYSGWSGVGAQFALLYQCPNVDIEETSVYMNTGRTRPMRAPGWPTGNIGQEQMMDALAEKLGMDPVEFRLKNAATRDQMENKPLTSNGLPASLTEGARVFGWREARNRPKQNGHFLRGVGVASGCYHVARGTGTAVLKIYPDGTALLNFGAADVGTGFKTIAAQVVTEELGIPADRIQMEYADTATTQFTGPSGGSKTIVQDLPPIRLAAAQIKDQLIQMAAQQLKVPASELAVQDGAIVVRGGARKVPFSELAQLRSENGIVAMAKQRPFPTDTANHQSMTHFSEVEVNTLTGEVRVVRQLNAQDGGRVINPVTFRNQAYGGIVWGIGLEITEERILDEGTGTMLNANFHDYKIPTSMETPEVICLPIDSHDTDNVCGVKGIGEPVNIPAASAIANAFYNATGVRVKEGPLTPAKVLALLAERKTRG